jgi:hypothetical protein
LCLEADSCTATNHAHGLAYSIISSAAASSIVGRVRPSALAAGGESALPTGSFAFTEPSNHAIRLGWSRFREPSRGEGALPGAEGPSPPGRLKCTSACGRSQRHNVIGGFGGGDAASVLPHPLRPRAQGRRVQAGPLSANDRTGQVELRRGKGSGSGDDALCDVCLAPRSSGAVLPPARARCTRVAGNARLTQAPPSQ